MLSDFFRKQNVVIFIAIFYCLILFINALFFAFTEIFNIGDFVFSEPPSLTNRGILGMIVKGLIIAPLLETLIYQQFIYYILSKLSFLKNQTLLICIVSGIVFGLAHTYSLIYMIQTSLIGFVFMYAFLIHIKNLNKSFWLVTFIHFMVNLSVFLEQLL
ncbi:MAG: hypothetical protein BGP01_03690 [Paludibacter sp. 47-17]|nr:MAG: hypothetical protein BGP01_03690 [Paludibacter sp. 47-17]